MGFIWGVMDSVIESVNLPNFVSEIVKLLIYYTIKFKISETELLVVKGNPKKMETPHIYKMY